MSFVVAKGLTRNYDLSEPLIVRALTMRPKRILTAVDNVNFSIEKVQHTHLLVRVAQENQQ